MPNETILVVDDEAHILELIRFNLESAGYKVEVAEDGETALKFCRQQVPDLIILDIMLPGIDGLEVCKTLRASVATAKVPIIMLTAKGEEIDKVVGLEIGADDYIAKPFGIRELIARVKALLRRTENSDMEPKIIKLGGLTIDTSKYEVYKNGNKLDFTLKEFELLKLLVLNQGKVLSRDYLLDQVWGYEYFGETRTVDVHIRHIRQKLGDNMDEAKYIETIRGVGYKFIASEEGE
ncbi:response regulator transcription factor [Mahella sp.]|jgi:two-component system alkaline phosphatase synthesis response regulator PhoP|uniref:response regulator transcription factor n=1 Tax=Mahella sp. TaxID=2798721 RepID=UPI0025B7B523|nr:response regulator transcription factor [Mahella sp.]MBZ4666834.1 two component transcriptional regulator, winged helix family [Mahella sp.]MDK2903743.1 two-component system, OmpR family, alkaline phosphatase synthesis response regulator PhoP [Clostridiales bacterium]MDK2991366.1 two-component system, OmpR family, alkaline phosphatase synthesis response regulator PhoP [Clostridiales bacterium]